MRMKLIRFARPALLIVPVCLAACGGNKAATLSTPKPSPKTAPTAAHQVVLQATIPDHPSKGAPPTPTPGPAGSHGKLPTVPPLPTATSIPAKAYTAVIFGTVTDKKSGSPIPGALVSVVNSSHSKRTTSYGEFRFSFPSGVAAPVTVSAPGYAGALAMGKLRVHQKLRVNFQLVRIVPGKPVVPPLPTIFGS